MQQLPLRQAGTLNHSDLLHRILDWNNLLEAWEKVRENKGQPGVDEVSIKRFARRLDENLEQLAASVRDGSYRPGALRKFTINTGLGKSRLIGILTVKDRVLQRATLNVLEILFEPRFHRCSFGYRHGRSLQQAVERIVRLRDRGYWWVLDADIDDCFPSLDHALLMGFVRDVISDEEVLRLIQAWIRLGLSRSESHSASLKGVAMGAVISPLLANVYLNQLDEALLRRRYKLVRYADDFVILCRTKEEAEGAASATERILGRLKLGLHPEKTRVTNFEQGFTFLGCHFLGSDYSFVVQDKRVVVDELPPRFLKSVHPYGYE